MPLWRAAENYRADGVPVVIVAGERYGAGSSRDWAAKGAALLGTSAIIASSFERIHRANLIGMGILPLLLPSTHRSDGLGISVLDWFRVSLEPEKLSPRCPVPVDIIRPDGTVTHLVCQAAVDTEQEVAALRAGGIMSLILERAKGSSSSL